MCLIPEAEEEPPAELPVWREALVRGRWLLGLLVLQSTSSFVLDSYQDLLRVRQGKGGLCRPPASWTRPECDRGHTTCTHSCCMMTMLLLPLPCGAHLRCLLCRITSW
jgi:hypothetical protein